MLRVTTIHASSAVASARYYTRYLAQDGPESEGVWLGRQADALGLSGVVRTEDLEAVLSGRDPATGTRLGRALVDRVDAKGRLIRAVAGFDATFSAPKSLSVWWGLTGDPGLLEAHDVAVRAVLDHLERCGATTRVRVNGARQHPDVQGLTMAAFRQATSREDDPQLHTHVVVSAKVRAPDGAWMALDARYLKRHQRALGGLYQSVLRAELTHRYGVAWAPIVNGQAEIDGMPRELLEVFSKRTAQVDEMLAVKLDAFREREGRDPTRWERAAMTREAAADSRAAKTGASVDELAGTWKTQALALGWAPDRLAQRLQAAARQAPEREPATITAVFDQLSAAGSTWTRTDVLQAICDLTPTPPQLPGLRWAASLERAADRVVEQCTILDPPAAGVPTRASDGRSIWIAPVEAHLTNEAVLAQEERILAFALDAHTEPARPSPTVDRTGLDVLQADAASAVAGHDPLVVVVGPAGAGKTTALRRAVEDLHRQQRPVFGVAPTAKAAKVLHDETGIPADTLAKLLYEWRRDRHPDARHRLPAGTTVVLDEAGMCGTSALDELVRLAVSQRWRLVLVGDPRQLQAVGRGGMFDELCRTSRTVELATLHRFRRTWEQTATLQLRAGRPAALDAYLDHNRVTSGGLADLLEAAARRWADQDDTGHAVAVTAETNEHVAQLNRAIQQHRRVRGDLGTDTVRVADGETAAVGDVVVTRRNDRTLLTDKGQPVRNRERWVVTGVGRHGELTVSHLDGHGRITLPPDYVRSQVQLGYAATAHGHQGDTVDVSLTVVTSATSHRSLYVGATRGRDHNQLLVVTDSADPAEARDVLERVLTNDRADVPAVAQRRSLAQQQRIAPRPDEAEAQLTMARRALVDARRDAEPYLRAVRDAGMTVKAASSRVDSARAAMRGAAPWRRRALTRTLRDASAELEIARVVLDEATDRAEPHAKRITVADDNVHDAERRRSAEHMRERLRLLEVQVPDRAQRRGIAPPER